MCIRDRGSIEPKGVEGEAAGAEHLEIGIGSESGQVGGGYAEESVNLIFLHGDAGRCLIGDDFHRNGLNRRGLAMIVFIPLQYQLFAVDPFFQIVSAGADGIAVKGGAIGLALDVYKRQT